MLSAEEDLTYINLSAKWLRPSVDSESQPSTGSSITPSERRLLFVKSVRAPSLKALTFSTDRGSGIWILRKHCIISIKTDVHEKYHAAAELEAVTVGCPIWWG